MRLVRTTRLAAGFAPLLFAVTLSAPVLAQEHAAGRPDHAIELGVGESSTIGYWIKQSERTDLGFRVAASIRDIDESTQTAILFGPALRFYRNSPGSLAPYTQVGLDLSYIRHSNNDVSRDAWGVLGRVGLGLDWFPIESFSVGGHVGAVVSYEDLDYIAVQGIQTDRSAITFRTFSSGILVRLLF